MFGNKKKEMNYAEQVETLLGEEARYEEKSEGLTDEVCPLLSYYGNYAVCNHLVRASYAGCSYDYIYEIDVYPSSTDKTNPAFHGSILKLHNIETFQKIYCCTEKPSSFSELKGSGWVEQEKTGKLRVWTEGGRLHEKEVSVIGLYSEWMKQKNSALCYFHSKDYAFYFEGKSMIIIFNNFKRISLERKLYGINVFLFSLEEKKILKDKGEKSIKENHDFYHKEISKILFSDTVQYKK